MHFSAEGQAGLTVFGTGLTVFLNQGPYPSLKPSSGTWLNNILWIRAFMIHCLQQCKPELYLMMLGTRPVWMGLVDVPLMRREDCVVVHRTGSQGQWNCKPAGQCKCCIKQQFSLNVQHAVAISPVQLWKNPSSWANKVMEQAEVKISTFLTYTYVKFHQCFFYMNPNNAYKCYLNWTL